MAASGSGTSKSIGWPLSFSLVRSQSVTDIDKDLSLEDRQLVTDRLDSLGDIGSFERQRAFEEASHRDKIVAQRIAEYSAKAMHHFEVATEFIEKSEKLMGHGRKHPIPNRDMRFYTSAIQAQMAHVFDDTESLLADFGEKRRMLQQQRKDRRMADNRERNREKRQRI